MKTAIWFVIVLLPFFNFFIAPNVSFADVGLLIGCMAVFFRDYKSIYILRKTKHKYLIILLIWTVLSSLFLLLNPANDHVNYLGIINNSLRFLFIIYLFINLRFFFRNNSLTNYTIIVWIKVIYFVCFLGFIEYLLQFVGVYYSYYVDGITTTTSRVSSQSFRISSVFNEPSYLVIYLNISLIVISEYYKQNKATFRMNYKRVLYTSLLTILLAQSLLGIALIILVLVLYKDLIFGKSLRKNGMKIGLGFSFVAGVLIYLNFDRIQAVYALEDGSANHRLLGSVELANKIIEKNYLLTGVGIGQQKQFLLENTLIFNNHFFNKKVSRNSGINNMFVLIFFQIGIVGLTLYLFFLYDTFKENKKIFLFLIVSGFGWAFTFNPLYWFCISILNILINGRKKNLVYLN